MPKKKVVRASGRTNKRSKKSFVPKFLSKNRRVALFVAALVVIVAGGLIYANSASDMRISQNSLDGEVVLDEESCFIGNEVGDVVPGCESIATQTEGQSTCAYELPAEEAANCPEQAILGESTTTTPMVWPIKKENWPKTQYPIANCDLLYSKDANRTVSTGFEIAVPKGTAVYAAADGVVHYVQPGTGALIVRTNLISSENTGKKPIFTAYLLLSERYVNKGDKVVKNQLVGRSGGGGTASELKESLHFGVWITGDFIGGHPTLNSANGQAILSKMLHPMNFLPLDGRDVTTCKDRRPYGLPVSTATPPPSTGGGTSSPSVSFPLKTTKSAIKNRSIFKGGTTSQGGHPYIAYDIYVKAGTPELAMVAGKVTKITKDRCGGSIVGVYSAAENRRYSYMHMTPSSIRVKLGASVKAGAILGTVGATRAYSCNTVDHLHIDVVRGTTRPSCSRLSCTTAAKRMFVNIGPTLYNTYQKLPN